MNNYQAACFLSCCGVPSVAEQEHGGFGDSGLLAVLCRVFGEVWGLGLGFVEMDLATSLKGFLLLMI